MMVKAKLCCVKREVLESTKLSVVKKETTAYQSIVGHRPQDMLTDLYQQTLNCSPFEEKPTRERMQ